MEAQGQLERGARRPGLDGAGDRGGEVADGREPGDVRAAHGGDVDAAGAQAVHDRVDDQPVLEAVFDRGGQRRFGGAVAGVGRTPRDRARHGPRRHARALPAHEQLRGRAHETVGGEHDAPALGGAQTADHDTRVERRVGVHDDLAGEHGLGEVSGVDRVEDGMHL